MEKKKNTCRHPSFPAYRYTPLSILPSSISSCIVFLRSLNLSISFFLLVIGTTGAFVAFSHIYLSRQSLDEDGESDKVVDESEDTRDNSEEEAWDLYISLLRFARS